MLFHVYLANAVDPRRDRRRSTRSPQRLDAIAVVRCCCAIEIFVLWLPILFHGIYGLFIVQRGASTTSPPTHVHAQRSLYSLQRITGVIAFLFLGVPHVHARASSNYVWRRADQLRDHARLDRATRWCSRSTWSACWRRCSISPTASRPSASPGASRSGARAQRAVRMAVLGAVRRHGRRRRVADPDGVPMMHRRTERGCDPWLTQRLIVVGGGLAGLMTTIKIAEVGVPVDLFSVVPVKRSHSVCAQGGINAAVNWKGEGDTPCEHFDDTHLRRRLPRQPAAGEGDVRARAGDHLPARSHGRDRSTARRRACSTSAASAAR